MQSNYMQSCAIDENFTIAGREFTGAYFLADGIYPDFPYFVKTVSVPTTPVEKVFAKAQEGLRKDVERGFGRLLAKWHILAGAGRSWKLKYMKNVWTTCFILHNMTLRDQEMTQEEFDQQEEARNQIGEEESIFAVPPIELSDDDEDEDPTSSDGEEAKGNSGGEEDKEPRRRRRPVDGDKTDDEVDYEEGIDRGFRAVKTRREGKDFNGVMTAMKQMENKSECIAMRKSLMEHIWALPRKNVT